MREGRILYRPGGAAMVLCAVLAIGLTGCGEADVPWQADTPAKELLTIGWDLVDRANWELAEKAFAAALDAGEDDEQKARAVFGLAYVNQYRNLEPDEAKALTLYERIGQDYPQTTAAPYATMALARAADAPRFEEDRNVEKAREYYRDILNRWAGHIVADEAALWLAISYLQEAEESQRDVGEQILQEYLEANPDNIAAAMMHHHLAGLYRDRKEWRKALAHHEQELKIDEDFGEGEAAEEARDVASELQGVPIQNERGTVCFAMAKIAEEELQDYALAAKYYGLIVKYIPRDQKYYVAKLKMIENQARAEAAAATQPGVPVGGDEGEEQ